MENQELYMSELQTLSRMLREKITVAEMDGATDESYKLKVIRGKIETKLNYLPEYQTYLQSVRDRINGVTK